MLSKLLLTACVALAIPTGHVMAQSMNLDADGQPFSSRYYQKSPKENVIALIRKPGLADDQFVLRITDSHPRSGCAKVSDYGYSAEYKDVYLDIAIGPMTIDLRDQPQYAHFECGKQTKMPTADIVINKSDLMQNQVQKIRLHNGPDTNYYTVTFNDDMVKILPDSTSVSRTRFKPQQIPHKKTSLVYWFYPAGTMIMWVPGMNADDDNMKKLQDFAAAKGLVPLRTIMPGFESPTTKPGLMYFVDTAGHYSEDDPDLHHGKPIGAITTEKMIYGLERDEIELDELAVYAKLPGMYD